MSGPADKLVRGGALDGLRFAASAFIVLYHFQDKAPVEFSSLHPGLARAYLATDLFLLLSGYVLARAYGARLSAGALRAGEFLRRRVTRVWPAHLLVLAAMAALVLGAQVAGLALNDAEAFAWRELPGHALLIQAWGLGVTQGWNFPTWSLSALIVCYALFPALNAAGTRLGPRTALALSIVALVACDLAARAVGHDFFAVPQGVGVLRAVPLFAFGVCLARFGAPRALTRARARTLWIVAGAAVLALQLAGRWDLVSILLIGAVVLGAGARASSRPSTLIARGAELSFALYITHALVGMVWFRLLDMALPADSLGEPARWALWASGFPVALLCAWLFHRVIDSPLQGLIERRRSPRPADKARGGETGVFPAGAPP